MADDDVRKLPGMVIRGNEPKQVQFPADGHYVQKHKSGFKEEFEVYRDSQGKTRLRYTPEMEKRVFEENENITMQKLDPKGRTAPKFNPEWLPPSRVDLDDLPIEVKRQRRQYLQQYLDNPKVPEKEKRYWRMRQRMFREDI